MTALRHWLLAFIFKQLKLIAFGTRNKRTKKRFLLLVLTVFGVVLLFRGRIPERVSKHTACPEHFLPHEDAWEYGHCLPHQASDDSCATVKKSYRLDPSLTKCKASPSSTVCQMHFLPSLKRDDVVFRVHCDDSICKKHNRSESIQVLNVNPSDGTITEAGRFLNVVDLEEALLVIIRENIERKFHFVILRCTLKGTNKGISQLIPIDPQITIRTNASKPRDKNLVNVNIALLDSVSRAHFYRSLPKTIELFKTWRNDPRSAPAMVFDFELFQAVDGHTTENTHALFNGKLLPLERSNARHSVNPGNMFGTFYKAGYQTMWQEDLCWKASWGLMIDLLTGSWGNLAKRLQENFIDHSGMTHAGCEILEYIYGITTPFMGPPGEQICYDGRFHHSYILQYTLDTIKAITSTPTALPLLSYMSLSVGHDHIGRRIQTLDPALVEYVNELSLSEDTITIMLSDHGNTYTSYTASLEGRFEMFHPHLFVIIPNKVARRLGKEALNALRINQHRLVNIIDLHHSIMALSKPLDGSVSPSGLFTPISTGRTCDNLELRMPNLCVCQGWDTPTSNDDMKIVLVEFAVGYLNNQIETQLIKQSVETNSTLPFHRVRSCHRMRAILLKDVRERRVPSRGTLITTMLIYVAAGNIMSHKEEVFNVMIESRELAGQRSLDMTFLHYDRMSMYGQYKVCADKGILLKLCICSKKTKTDLNYLNVTSLLAPPNSIYLGQETVSKVSSQSDCIFIISRTHKKAFAYDLANVCKHASFLIAVDVQSTKMRLTRSCPFQVTLLADNIQFILSARKEKLHVESSIKVIAKIIKTMELKKKE